MEPAVASWHIERRGRLTVLVPDGPAQPLTDDDVRKAIELGRDPEARDRMTRKRKAAGRVNLAGRTGAGGGSTARPS